MEGLTERSPAIVRRPLFTQPLLPAALVLLSLMSLLAGVKAPPATAATDRGQPHEIVVRWRDAVPRHRPEALSALGARRPLSADSLEVVGVPADQRVEDVAARIERDPRVLQAEPNHRIDLLTDPDFERQWGLNNTGQDVHGTSSVTDVDVDALESWMITRGASSTVVAVTDTGVDIGHPDLRANIWTNQVEANGTPGRDDDSNGYVDDVHGWDFYHGDSSVYDGAEDFHGTHVAGIIAAAENGVGTVGVAPEVTIMPLKFIGPYGGTLADALDAIDYAADHGAHILNASWSISHDSNMLRDALADSGMLVVAAAGNDGEDLDTTSTPTYPAAYDLPNLISVAAVDSRGELAWFSNYGKQTVEVGAPGVSVWSTAPDGTYEWLSGTSMAAPHVAGAAALLQGFTVLRPGQVIRRLTKTAKPLSSLRQSTSSGGVVATAAALGHVPMPPGAVPLQGDWDGDGVDQTGFRKGRSIVLRRSNGLADSYQWGRPGDIPVTGDWDKDGIDTIGLYRDNCFFFSNELVNPEQVERFCYGTRGDLPVAGDWNGDGRDTLSIVRPSDGRWFLNNHLRGGDADRVFVYGRVAAGDHPISGDWNGDGRSGVGVIRGDQWLLKNRASGGAATWQFHYGRTSAGDLPIPGAWSGDGTDDPVIVRNGTWYLRDRLSSGSATLLLTWSTS